MRLLASPVMLAAEAATATDAESSLNTGEGMKPDMSADAADWKPVSSVLEALLVRYSLWQGAAIEGLASAGLEGLRKPY